MRSYDIWPTEIDNRYIPPLSRHIYLSAQIPRKSSAMFGSRPQLIQTELVLVHGTSVVPRYLGKMSAKHPWMHKWTLPWFQGSSRLWPAFPRLMCWSTGCGAGTLMVNRVRLSFFFAFSFLGSRLHRFRTLGSHRHMIHYIVRHSCWCPTLYVVIVCGWFPYDVRSILHGGWR